MEQGPTTTSQPIILAFEDIFTILAGRSDKFGGFVRDGQVVGEDGRGDQWFDFTDAEVVCLEFVHGVFFKVKMKNANRQMRGCLE